MCAGCAHTHTHSLTWRRRWGQTLGTGTGRRGGPRGHGCRLQARVGLGKVLFTLLERYEAQRMVSPLQRGGRGARALQLCP